MAAIFIAHGLAQEGNQAFQGWYIVGTGMFCPMHESPAAMIFSRHGPDQKATTIHLELIIYPSHPTSLLHANPEQLLCLVGLLRAVLCPFANHAMRHQHQLSRQRGVCRRRQYLDLVCLPPLQQAVETDSASSSRSGFQCASMKVFDNPISLGNPVTNIFCAPNWSANTIYRHLATSTTTTSK